MKIHNFSAGPSILPEEVFQKSAHAVINFEGMGLSILEISHRSKQFVEVLEEAESLVSELLDLPSHYKTIFLSGGASSQFFMVPMNLLPVGGQAAYLNTGTWSAKAIIEGQRFGKINILASSEDKNFSYIPKTWNSVEHNQYLHITSNNTIFGTQYHNFPQVSIPMVGDMSSDIFSRQIPVEKFDLIYAGAQKNMGPAGTTLVIVNQEALGKTQRDLPAMIDYRQHIQNSSSYNTPPVFPIYVSMLVMRWLKEQGGIPAIEKRNQYKAQLLYQEIDDNPLFYGTADIQDRSLMNACFLLKDENLTPEFMKLALDAGISGIKGHRSVGGFRASLYNALPLESVEVLIEIMRHFALTKG
jgi:phosphoserine aminotransferase